MSFQVSLENRQGFRITDGGGVVKYIITYQVHICDFSEKCSGLNQEINLQIKQRLQDKTGLFWLGFDVRGDSRCTLSLRRS